MVIFMYSIHSNFNIRFINKIPQINVKNTFIFIINLIIEQFKIITLKTDSIYFIEYTYIIYYY